MRVIYKTWRGSREMDLEDALAPVAGDTYGLGSVEQAAALAEANARAIGKLAALLVERRLISLDEAAEACGFAGDISAL